MSAPSQSQRFNKVVWPLMPVVLRTATFLCRDRTDAEDVSQETMLRAFRYLDNLRDDAAAKPWLMTILRHAHVDRLRAHAHDEVSLDFIEADPVDPRAGRFDAAYRFDQNPDHAIELLADADVIRALRLLPADIRWTLLLVDVEGMVDADAAAALGVPKGTVKSRLHRGRAMLRDGLRPTYAKLHHRALASHVARSGRRNAADVSTVPAHGSALALA
jgi:RNA polymerase sigma-70 factor (ECF subfamily)